MKIKNLFLLAFVAISMTFASCGGDDVDCNDDAALEAAIEDETLALFTTGEAYTLDPTNSDLCNDYADAIKDWLDAVDSIKDCVPADEKEEFDSSIEIIESSLDDLDC